MSKDFLRYLEETEETTIEVLQKNENNELRTLELPYLHRWSETRQRQVLARFYKLEEWYNANPHPVTFITLTTRQTCFDRYEEQYNYLRDAYQRLRLNIKKMKGTVNYIWVIEPHKSGFVHIHMMFFCTFTTDEKERLMSLWCDKYGIGVRQAQDVREIEIDRVKYLRTYLFKYLAKTWQKGTMQDDHLLTHNAVLWSMGRRESIFRGMRSYGTSQELTKIMKLDKPLTVGEWETIRTSMGESVLYENKELVEEFAAEPSDRLPASIRYDSIRNKKYESVPPALEPEGFESRGKAANGSAVPTADP